MADENPIPIRFIVPFVVQISVNAILQFKNQDIKTLSLLSGQRRDPAFIMDHSGRIVMSTGKTEQLFRNENISDITDLIETDDFERLLQKLDHS